MLVASVRRIPAYLPRPVTPCTLGRSLLEEAQARVLGRLRQEREERSQAYDPESVVFVKPGATGQEADAIYGSFAAAVKAARVNSIIELPPGMSPGPWLRAEGLSWTWG